MRRWLDEIEALMRELEGFAPGDQRSFCVARLHGMRAEGKIQIVGAEVDPEATGAHLPTRRPQVATVDEVRISRRDGYAVIEYVDRAVSGVDLRLDDVETMTDREILDAHDEVIESINRARAEREHLAVELPAGKPQIAYRSESDQWIPRGDVLRCTIHDADREARVVVEDILTPQEAK